MSDMEKEPVEPTLVEVLEKIELLQAEVAFLEEGLVDLAHQVTQLGGFINFVFSITAQQPQQEAPQDEQPQS